VHGSTEGAFRQPSAALYDSHILQAELAMDCENCGAPMTLYGDRDIFYCEFCGSFRFPSESSDGIRVLGLANGEAAALFAMASS
jgi:hypothetical protein